MGNVLAGKSLIVKAIEHRFHANLFPVTAFYFDGESPGEERKMVQDLFAVARDHQVGLVVRDLATFAAGGQQSRLLLLLRCAFVTKPSAPTFCLGNIAV